MQKFSLYTLIILVIAAAGVTIAQIWVPVMDWDTYFKLLGTIGILCVVLGLVLVIRADLGEKKKLRDEHYLD